jgi:phosphate uptake regulator
LSFEEYFMPGHTVKAIDTELEILGRKIVEMGGIAEKMLSDAMDALVDFDIRLAQQTVYSDPRLDLLQRDIEEQAILSGSAISPRISPNARSRLPRRCTSRARPSGSGRCMNQPLFF